MPHTHVLPSTATLIHYFCKRPACPPRHLANVASGYTLPFDRSACFGLRGQF
jgi:hypothetical protein